MSVPPVAEEAPVAKTSSPRETPAPAVATTPADTSKDAAYKGAPSAFDTRIAAIIATVRAARSLAPDDAKARMSDLLVSTEPQDQVAGLVLMAGLGLWDAQFDWTKVPSSTVLAAIDLCGSLFDDDAARELLDRWTAGMGGTRAAGEAAHNSLTEGRLPYGGGSTALKEMIGVNDPQAILVGLCEFAVYPKLPPGTRTEAVLRVRDYMPADEYLDFVRECADRAQNDAEAWANRAARLLKWLDVPATMPAGTRVVDSQFITDAFAQPYSGLVEDLDSYLRIEAAASRITMDDETAVYLRQTLANLNEVALPGPDQAASQRLLHWLDSWISAW